MRQSETISLKGGLTALALVVAVLAASDAFAVPGQVEISSSLNPVGSGARATGMGGAFIAVADDATAASWNPAGLVHLEKPELSIVHSYKMNSQTYHASAASGLDNNKNDTDFDDINYLSAAFPFQFLKRNMIVTLNYQRLFDMNKQYNFSYNVPGMPAGDTLAMDTKFSQSGGLSAISPAIAIQVLPELYFGATVNIWDDIHNTASWKSSGQYVTNTTIGGLALPASTDSWNQEYSFSGLNANLGLIYSLKGKYNFGFVYKTPFTGDVDQSSTFNGVSTTEKFKMSMPASYGAGFSYRHSDSLSMALDVYRTEWSSFKITDSKGVIYNPLTSEKMQFGGKGKDTTQIRVGGEYLMIGDKVTVPVRAGFYYDPQPGVRLVDGSGANNVYAAKIDDFFGFSVGSGLAMGNYAFDFSYQYRWGNRVTSDIPYTGTAADITQHTIMTSLIYHF